jgi:hypothetical protein
MPTEILNDEFASFLKNVPAKRLKQSITKLLLYFLKFEDTGELPDFMDALYTDFLFLFDLLDVIDREMDQSGF